MIEDLHMAGAIHRLDRQNLAVRRLAGEHVVVEVLPVAGAFPQGAVEHLRRLHLDITLRLHPSTDVVLQGAVEGPALGVPEDHAPALFLKMEEIHGRADLAMVALFGLFDALEIGRQIGVRRPRRAVDALQLGVRLIASPIGAGQLGQLEGLADVARGRQMRAATEVFPLTLTIDGDRLIAGNIADDLRLVGFADTVEMGDGFGAVPHLARDRFVAIDDLAHARFDLGQVVERERFGAREIVIEAVLDIGTDGHLGVGKQFLHRLGQDVGGVVADGVQRLRPLPGNDFDGAAALQRAGKIQKLAVQLDQQGLLFQGFGDRGGDVAAGHAGIERAHRTVGEFQINHLSNFLGRSGVRSEGEPGHSPIRPRDGNDTDAAWRASRRARVHE